MSDCIIVYAIEIENIKIIYSEHSLNRYQNNVQRSKLFMIDIFLISNVCLKSLSLPRPENCNIVFFKQEGAKCLGKLLEMTVFSGTRLKIVETFLWSHEAWNLLCYQSSCNKGRVNDLKCVLKYNTWFLTFCSWLESILFGVVFANMF